MGGLMSLLAEGSIDEYIISADDVWTTVELDEEVIPKSHRLKNVDSSLMSKEGSTAGRVARGLISHACSLRDIQWEITTPDANCVHLALNEILQGLTPHSAVPLDQIVCMKVPKNEQSIMQCISNGYVVSAVVPVTNELFDRKFERPSQDSDVFTMVPVLLWGYSSTSKKFAAFVPLPHYPEAIAIPFSHVTCETACDFYLVDIHDQPEDTECHTPLFF